MSCTDTIPRSWFGKREHDGISLHVSVTADVTNDAHKTSTIPRLNILYVRQRRLTTFVL
jgi:hypothetical protein